MSGTVPKPMRAIVKLAQEHGWVFDISGSCHPRLTPPPGTVSPYTGQPAIPIVFSCTPSDTRSMTNSIAELRRAGIPIPRKNQQKKEKR